MESKKKILKKAVKKAGKGGLDMSKLGVGKGQGQGLANRSAKGLEKGVGAQNRLAPVPSSVPGPALEASSVADKYRNLRR